MPAIKFLDRFRPRVGTLSKKEFVGGESHPLIADAVLITRIVSQGKSELEHHESALVRFKNGNSLESGDGLVSLKNQDGDVLKTIEGKVQVEPDTVSLLQDQGPTFAEVCNWSGGASQEFHADGSMTFSDDLQELSFDRRGALVDADLYRNHGIYDFRSDGQVRLAPTGDTLQMLLGPDSLEHGDWKFREFQPSL